MHRFERYWERLSRIYDEEQQLLLNEPSIKLYPTSTFTSGLYDLYPKCPRKLVVMDSRNSVVLQYGTDISKDVDFQQLVEACGYVISNVVETTEKYKFKFILELKFTGTIPHNTVPAHVYHVSSRVNRTQILKDGITPDISKATFIHPSNRIYLLTVNPFTESSSCEYDVFEIETNSDYSYYHDPDFQFPTESSTGHTIFSLRNIDRHYIRLINDV